MVMMMVVEVAVAVAVSVSVGATVPVGKRVGVAARCSSTTSVAGGCQPPGDHNGTLPCLRCGRSVRFDRNTRRPATILRRVSDGSITSSMKPRSAAA